MRASDRRAAKQSGSKQTARSKLTRSALSEEEKDLLQRAMKGVAPISNDRVEPHKAAPKAKPNARRATLDQSVAADAGLQILDLDQLANRQENLAGAHLEWSDTGVSSRTMRDLRRGLYEYRATLDLHGLTAENASRRLAAFLQHCENESIRSLIVVHGKGFGSDSGVPVIKSNVERWLISHPQVIAFCSAQPRDGGTGAVYVLLRGRAPIVRRKRTRP